MTHSCPFCGQLTGHGDEFAECETCEFEGEVLKARVSACGECGCLYEPQRRDTGYCWGCQERRDKYQADADHEGCDMTGDPQ